jgi:ribonucleotide monophosphatase NagD (HAD superfamily)
MKSFLIDLDGVLYVGKKPVEGARECLERLDELGYDYRFVSNSTRRCRSSMAKRLEGFGYQVQPRQIFTPPPAAIQRIMRSKKNRCFLLSTGDVHLELRMLESALPTKMSIS